MKNKTTRKQNRKRVFALLAAICLLLPAAAFAAKANFPLEKGDSGDQIVIIQQRLIDLGYLHFRPTGSYGDMTYQGVLAFQENNGIAKDGMVGEDTYSHLYDAGKVRAPINPAIVRTVGPGLLATPTEYGELSSWEDIDKLFPVGDTVTVTDFNTLRTYRVTRTGGKNHADVQTVNAEAQSEFMKCFGGDYTWEKRAVLVEINGKKYAASIFGMPNANDKLKNGHMSGSVCLYFSGSTSDIGGIADAEHAANIIKAGGQ
ncbi:MAG: peptidoglycan-binding protein [Christensenellaceae bacterium]|nr:peptidoglycan-binding protein [Christensenellaceae bacterium]